MLFVIEIDRIYYVKRARIAVRSITNDAASTTQYIGRRRAQRCTTSIHLVSVYRETIRVRTMILRTSVYEVWSDNLDLYTDNQI